MKKIFSVAVIMMLLALTSCKDKGTYSSPKITFVEILINDKKAEESVMCVGDTLKIGMALSSYYNRLTYFNVTTDRSYIKDSIFSDADFATLCNTEASDRSTGRYVFKTFDEGTAIIINKAMFIATKSPNSSDKSVLLQFDLKNDSPLSDEFNPISYRFKFKIVEKESSEEEEEEVK